MDFKQSYLFIEFPCIWLHNLTAGERRSDFLIYNIRFAALFHSAARGGDTTRPHTPSYAPVCVHKHQ